MGYHLSLKNAAHIHGQPTRFDNKMIKRQHYDTGVRHAQ